ncbi:MAG: ribokinaselike protein [Frankiales bacterium]|nr:ribokinaselike protein [Frankiales bacterium]
MLLIVGEALVAFQRDLGRPDDPPRPPDASGAPAIASYIAARLGVPTAFVGGVGSDELGQFFRDTIYAAGVTPATVQVSPDRPTATVGITYDAGGSRAFDFAVTSSAALEVGEAALNGLPERADWLHLSGSALFFGEPLASTAIAAARRAHAAGARVSVDPNIRLEAMTAQSAARLREMIGLAHLVLPSEGELEALGLTEDELLERGAIVCRTMGAEGAVVRTGDASVSVPAVADPAAVMDTDGAGDTFAAAFIAATLDGADPVAAARVASRVVARAIAVLGPMSVVLSPADLRRDDGFGECRSPAR